MSYSLNESVSSNLIKEITPGNLLQYYATRNNSLSNTIVEGISFVKTIYANQSDDWPDIELILTTGIIEDLTRISDILYEA